MTIKERRAYARKEEINEQQAKRRGVKVETLVNLWLQERLAEEAERAAQLNALCDGVRHR